MKPPNKLAAGLAADRAGIRSTVLTVLYAIAPEVATQTLEGDRPLRTQVDLDSMDWLNFLQGLHRQTGVDIPEADYASLITLDDVITYLQQRL